ncbi:uncharacterized protein [Montipora capricornis]|uniref:uncharacterized protein n=1 Tax=Montipora capricornis TaxID=246305 RepID=UPI0035F20869
MSASRTVYSNKELRFFRLAKCVVDHSSVALRKVFKREWNCLYPDFPWLDNRRSGAQFLTHETSSSRLLDPAYSAEYKHIKDNIEQGDVENWDVTALVFALKFSCALNPIRYGFRWRKINDAIYHIKDVKNTLVSHLPKASLSRDTFERNVDILLQAVEDLLSRSDPLIRKLQTLRNETEFATEDLLRYKQMVNDDRDSLLLLEEDMKKVEGKMKLETSVTEEARRSSETNHVNRKIIRRMRRRMARIEREMDARSVDLFPSNSKPAIFRSSRYIRLINTSYSMSYNFQWEELKPFLEKFDDDVDLKIFAGIQSAISLSHQSRKEEALKVLDSLIPKVFLAKHGVVLHARIKIRKAYILHDQGRDEEAKKEADEAEVMLSLGECHEDSAEIHNVKANIVLSASENANADRSSVLLHFDKCIHFCERATVDKSVTVVQATLRKAFVHLGYYQHGILEEVPGTDVKIAETILKGVSEQCGSLSERSIVYYNYGQSLLAYRKGNANEAIKLEHKVRKKCERHKIGFEIRQLDMLRTLIRGGSDCES